MWWSCWLTRGSQTQHLRSYKGRLFFVFKASISCGLCGRHRDGKHLKKQENNSFIYLRLNKTGLFCSWFTLTCLQWKAFMFVLFSLLTGCVFSVQMRFYWWIRTQLSQEALTKIRGCLPSLNHRLPFYLLCSLFLPLTLPPSPLSLPLISGSFFPLSKDYTTIHTVATRTYSSCLESTVCRFSFDAVKKYLARFSSEPLSVGSLLWWWMARLKLMEDQVIKEYNSKIIVKISGKVNIWDWTIFQSYLNSRIYLLTY